MGHYLNKPDPEFQPYVDRLFKDRGAKETGQFKREVIEYSLYRRVFSVSSRYNQTSGDALRRIIDEHDHWEAVGNAREALGKLEQAYSAEP